MITALSASGSSEANVKFEEADALLEVKATIKVLSSAKGMLQRFHEQGLELSALLLAKSAKDAVLKPQHIEKATSMEHMGGFVSELRNCLAAIDMADSDQDWPGILKNLLEMQKQSQAHSDG